MCRSGSVGCRICVRLGLCRGQTLFRWCDHMPQMWITPTLMNNICLAKSQCVTSRRSDCPGVSLGLVWVDQTKTFDSLGLAADSIEACERNFIVKSNILSSDSLCRAGVPSSKNRGCIKPYLCRALCCGSLTYP